MTKIPLGANVSIDQKRNEFLLVMYNNLVGWVLADRIQEIDY